MATAPEIAIHAPCPAGWVDKTMIIHSAPPDASGAPSPNIVVSRDALAEAETFREYCNRQVDAFRSTLPHFYREEEGPGRVHDLDAFNILFTWRSAGGPLRQRVFFISAGAGLVVTFAATAAADQYHRHEAAFTEGLAALRIGAAPARSF